MVSSDSEAEKVTNAVLESIQEINYIKPQNSGVRSQNPDDTEIVSG